MRIFISADKFTKPLYMPNKKTTKKTTKKRRLNTVRRAARKVDIEEGLKKKVGFEDTKKIVAILEDLCRIPKNKIYEVLEAIEKNVLKIEVSREMPEEVKPITDEMQKIFSWHTSGEFDNCNPDTLVREMNRLAALKASLDMHAAWYSTQATLSVMNRRNWKALAFSALRSFGKDLESNIKNKTTIADTDNQVEVMGMLVIGPQLYFSYVADYLQNILRSTRDVMTGIDRKLTELKHQRQTEGKNESY